MFSTSNSVSIFFISRANKNCSKMLHLLFSYMMISYQKLGEERDHDSIFKKIFVKTLTFFSFHSKCWSVLCTDRFEMTLFLISSEWSGPVLISASHSVCHFPLKHCYSVDLHANKSALLYWF